MKNAIYLSLLAIVLLACAKNQSESLILIKGGTFTNTQSNLYDREVRVTDFYMGKYEVTQKEWKEVMGSNPSNFKGDYLPVEMVSWYDAVEYCNKRSESEGLTPYYFIDKIMEDTVAKNELDSIRWKVTVNKNANGYRLPTEIEWEYVASGGQQSQQFTYSGSNNLEEVAWYWRNSGDEVLTGSWVWTAIESNNGRTHTVGSKNSNELGVHDLSGNVREWCEDWYIDETIPPGVFRSQRGGGWIGGAEACEISLRGKFEANGKGSDQGFRICRSVITN